MGGFRKVTKKKEEKIKKLFRWKNKNKKRYKGGKFCREVNCREGKQRSINRLLNTLIRERGKEKEKIWP